MRRKYLWRVTAHYRQEQPPRQWTTVRHYQSLHAAVARADQLRHGYPLGGHLPAERVDVERSAPVNGWQPVTDWKPPPVAHAGDAWDPVSQGPEPTQRKARRAAS